MIYTQYKSKWKGNKEKYQDETQEGLIEGSKPEAIIIHIKKSWQSRYHVRNKKKLFVLPSACFSYRNSLSQKILVSETINRFNES